jgi:hypothetical protein
VLFKGEEGQVLPRVVYNIVLTLARALDPPEVVKTIEEHYWKWVQEKVLSIASTAHSLFIALAASVCLSDAWLRMRAT